MKPLISRVKKRFIELEQQLNAALGKEKIGSIKKQKLSVQEFLDLSFSVLNEDSIQ